MDASYPPLSDLPEEFSALCDLVRKQFGFKGLHLHLPDTSCADRETGRERGERGSQWVDEASSTWMMRLAPHGGQSFPMLTGNWWPQNQRRPLAHIPLNAHHLLPKHNIHKITKSMRTLSEWMKQQRVYEGEGHRQPVHSLSGSLQGTRRLCASTRICC